jgi:hypothetical protein
VDDVFHLAFFQDGNAIGIEIARQLHGITTASDVGNLGCREGYDVKFRVVSEDYVEVVEVSASSSQDKHPFHSA